MGDVGDLLPPPYELADNPESLLAGQRPGLHRPGVDRLLPRGRGQQAGAVPRLPGRHRVRRRADPDLDVARNKRWMSPKFVAGESYGTLRGAALAEHLQSRHGMYLNGLILISSVLDLSSLDFEKQRNDRAHALYLPTYAAIAHYHGKVKRRSLRALVKEAEEYAAGDYPAVLREGNRLTAKERAAAVRKLASLTGLSRGLRRPRRPADRALALLRRAAARRAAHGGTPRRPVQRSDGLRHRREHGRRPGPRRDRGPYAAAFNHYVREELGFESDLPYEQISRRVHPWSYKDFEGRPIDVTPKLERAMRQNPHLRVHVAYGYYDGATPHFAAEDVVAHLNLPDELRANIEHAYYEAGHMMYVHEPTRRQQSRDLAAFVTRG